MIAVCSEIHRKLINTLCGQNVELMNDKLLVHMVTTGLWRFCPVQPFVVPVQWSSLSCSYSGNPLRFHLSYVSPNMSALRNAKSGTWHSNGTYSCRLQRRTLTSAFVVTLRSHWTSCMRQATWCLRFVASVAVHTITGWLNCHDSTESSETTRIHGVKLLHSGYSDAEYIYGFVGLGGVCMQSRWRHSVTVPHTRWRICVTMATLWQQQDGGYMLFYIFNSTVVDGNFFYFSSLQELTVAHARVIVYWPVCRYYCTNCWQTAGEIELAGWENSIWRYKILSVKK